VVDPHPLRVAYARQFPGEFAAYLVMLGGDAIPQALAGLPEAQAAALVAHLPGAHAARALAAQRDERIVEWLNEAKLDDALAIVLQLYDKRRARILDSLPNRRTRETLKRLLVYPRTTVGALADPTALRLDATLPLGEAVAILRSDDSGTARPVWLVDGDGRYVGLLDSNQALIARSEKPQLADLSIAVHALRADTTLANARTHPNWQQHAELPVVDHLDHLLGTLSHERLVAALGAENPHEAGLADVVSALTHQYFHVMGTVLGELFGLRGARR
jgi:Mg/Co/Ni transporter MgtE